jgi:tRNA(Ser,Leu) C12 N-acetylase TAN1
LELVATHPAALEAPQGDEEPEVRVEPVLPILVVREAEGRGNIEAEINEILQQTQVPEVMDPKTIKERAQERDMCRLREEQVKLVIGDALLQAAVAHEQNRAWAVQLPIPDSDDEGAYPGEE